MSLDLIANPRLPFGLRTVDGSFNNLVQDQTQFGAADNDFPLLLDQVFRNDLDGDTFVRNGPTPDYAYQTGYAGAVNVVDARPAHHLQPDRRSDDQQSGGGRGCGRKADQKWGRR